MTIRHLTILILVIATFALAIYDCYAESLADSNTITVVIRDGSKGSPILVILAGILIGHLFGQFPVELVMGIIVGTLWGNPVGAKILACWK